MYNLGSRILLPQPNMTGRDDWAQSVHGKEVEMKAMGFLKFSSPFIVGFEEIQYKEGQ